MNELMDITEAINSRRSVRTFDGTAVDEQHRIALRRFVDEAGIARPFGHASYSIDIVDVDNDGAFRPGTYGVIKGARTYLTMTVGPTRIDALTAGFVMEEVVLRAWQSGLGTCWLGGTFKTSTFLDSTSIPEGQTLRIVVPVGIPAERTRFMDRMARIIAGSDRRKNFGSMFFYRNWHIPLDKYSVFGRALESMRHAPSSTNSQPWRVLVIGDTVHFYGVRGNFSDIDMGIGICHFAICTYIEGLRGTFFDDPGHPTPPDQRTDYVCSYRLLKP